MKMIHRNNNNTLLVPNSGGGSSSSSSSEESSSNHPLLLSSNNIDDADGNHTYSSFSFARLGRRRRAKQIFALGFFIATFSIILFLYVEPQSLQLAMSMSTSTSTSITTFRPISPEEMNDPNKQLYYDLLTSMQENSNSFCKNSSNNNNNNNNHNHNLQFVGFWHIGGANTQHAKTSRDIFVQKQLEEIQSTYLFQRCNQYNVKLNYVTTVQLSSETKEILASDGRMHELPPTHIDDMKEEDEYYEFTTLMELYSYCIDLPDVEENDPVVFYIHSKSMNTWRLWMENFVMGQQCVNCLSDSNKMACGPSLVSDKGYIWQHFSGNFFMTRCQHIRKLNPPYTSQIMDEVKAILRVSNNVASGFPHSFPPYGRYVAEYWLMNDGKEGEMKEHMKDASLWPNLKNENEGFHESLIHQDNTCTIYPPSEITESKY